MSFTRDKNGYIKFWIIFVLTVFGLGILVTLIMFVPKAIIILIALGALYFVAWLIYDWYRFGF